MTRLRPSTTCGSASMLSRGPTLRISVGGPIARWAMTVVPALDRHAAETVAASIFGS